MMSLRSLSSLFGGTPAAVLGLGLWPVFFLSGCQAFPSPFPFLATVAAPAAVLGLGLWPVDTFLAQVPAPSAELLGKFMWGLLGALGVASLVLTVIVQYKKAFGARPPLSEVLAGLATTAHCEEVRKSVGDVKTKSEKDLEDLRAEAHLRARGLEEQISKVRHEKTSDYQALTSIGAEREHRLMEKLDENFRELTKERSMSTARLHDRVDASAKTLRDEIDTKLGDVRKEINDLPTRLITMLRDTGAIGGRPR